MARLQTQKNGGWNMDEKIKPTPRPWRIAGKGTIRTDTGYAPSDGWIADVRWRNRDANAAFIVRAVNAHADLVAALKELARIVVAQAWGSTWPGRPHAQMDAARAAISKAEGRS
jgi:hypothetical protein